MTAKKAKPKPPWLSGFCGADLPDESHARCRGEAAGMPCVCTREGVHSTPHLREPEPKPPTLDDREDMPPKPTDLVPTTVDAATIVGELTVSAETSLIGTANTLTLPDPHLIVDGVRFDDALDAIRARDGVMLAELGQYLADLLLHPPEVPDAVIAGHVTADATYRLAWADALTKAVRGLMYGPPKPPVECDCPPPYADCPHPPPVVP